MRWLPDPLENTRAEYAAYDKLPERLRGMLRNARMEHSARKVLAMLARTQDEDETAMRFAKWLESNDHETQTPGGG